MIEGQESEREKERAVSSPWLGSRLGTPCPSCGSVVREGQQ